MSESRETEQTELRQLVPGGAHTYSRGDDQFSLNTPRIFSRGQGANLFDLEGRGFIDFGMGLRSVTLGYANPEVNADVISAVQKGNCLTRPSEIEFLAAETFINTIPSAEMVKFGKNGSDATSAAVRLSRAATGRDLICAPREQPFFSFNDWFIGSTPVARGVERSSRDKILYFDFSDVDTLEALLQQFGQDVACVITEPSTHVTPCSLCPRQLDVIPCRTSCDNLHSNTLWRIRELCDSYGVIMIADEMITGFRWSAAGACDYFGVRPDLATFGKAMGNGFSVSALAGRRELMELGSIHEAGLERTFLMSSTHGGEMTGLAAFMAVNRIYKRDGICDSLWEIGTKFARSFDDLVKAHHLAGNIELRGPAVCLAYSFNLGDEGANSKARTLFQQILVSNGVIMPWISLSTAHTPEIVDRTMEAVALALSGVNEGMNDNFAALIDGPFVRPVFRRFN